MFCPNCGSQNEDSSNNCSNCGARLKEGFQQNSAGNGMGNNAEPPKSRLVAGLLGFFLGPWGVHNFYLGNTTRGVIQIFVTLFTCTIGGLWGIIEGIMILCGAIKTDADGRPLSE